MEILDDSEGTIQNSYFVNLKGTGISVSLDASSLISTDLNISNTLFENITGGALILEDPDTVYIENCTFINNTAA